MTTTRTMRLAIAAVLLALYGAAPAASAAGFSCSGELTIQERLVCGDAKLSALDYRMNALYAMAHQTKGAVAGHLALVEFEEGWSSRESFTVQALVAVSKGRVYWRTLTERLAEHYIPDQYVFRMPASLRKK